MNGPLSGIRVLDLSRILAGPWCTQLFADLGAEVTKVERPVGGDDTRGWGPPFVMRDDGSQSDESAYFLCANRGKRSIGIDLSRPEGQRLVKRLAEQADVIVENFKHGDMRRYGLDYASLSALNPRLIYCSITGFGQSGPYRERAGYDFVIQAMGGLMSVTGERDGLPGGGPQKCGIPVSDLMTGLYSAVAILGALHERTRSGLGQYIDMSLLDTQVGWLANQGLNYLVSGQPARRWGNAHPNLAPYQSFAARDGHLIVAVGNDRQFAALCRVLALSELAADPRYATNRDRLAHRDALVARLQPRFAERDRDGLLQALEQAGVPAGPINTMAQAFDDPHVKTRGMVFSMDHATGARVPQIANPIRLSRTPVAYRRPPPMLNQHTVDVLRDAGLSDTEIDALRDTGIVGQPAMQPAPA